MSGLLLSFITVFFRGLPCLIDCSNWSLAWAGLPFLDPPPNAGSPGGGGGGGPGRPAIGGGGGGNGMSISFKMLHTSKSKNKTKQNRVGQQRQNASDGYYENVRSVKLLRRGRGVCVCVCVTRTVGPVDDGTQ